MNFFRKNPNEVNYSGGKKHFTDVIKCTSSGEELLWLNPEEDFNTNSTLIVAESEEALFFKDGIIQQVFEGGRYTLSTDNYPFISRISNAFSGGISTFNCKVYFVRKTHSIEILWGTDTPVQVRDPKLGISTSLQGRGSYKIQVEDSKKVLLKIVGNNIQSFSQEEITRYFKNEFLMHIKSTIAKSIKDSNEEILGVVSDLVTFADVLKQTLEPIMGEYGLKLVNFVVSALDIPENDPNRQKLEAAFATKSEANIFGSDYNRFVEREILTNVSKNEGGIASQMAGFGIGVGAAPVLGNMVQDTFSKRETNNIGLISCSYCGVELSVGSKFCSSCGAKV